MLRTPALVRQNKNDFEAEFLGFRYNKIFVSMISRDLWSAGVKVLLIENTSVDLHQNHSSDSRYLSSGVRLQSTERLLRDIDV